MPAYICTITVKGTADSEDEARREIAEALNDPSILALLHIKQPSPLEENARALLWPCIAIAAFCAGALIR